MRVKLRNDIVRTHIICVDNVNTLRYVQLYAKRIIEVKQCPPRIESQVETVT